MDVELNMAAGESPLSMKADFLLSLCELVVGGKMCIRDRAMVPQSDASSQNIPSGNTAQTQRCRPCDAQH